MATPPSATSIQVESIVLPPYFKPPGTTNTLFLGGAGVRCIEIEGVVMKVSVTSVYLENKAISLLAAKWKGKTAAELTDSVEFYNDVITGSFEKLTQSTALVPITGKRFSETASELLAGVLKARGSFTDKDSETIDKFLEVFKDEIFLPGSSILLTTSPVGSLMISFVKDGIIPEAANVVIENEKLAQMIIESVIGINGVSPNCKLTLASRLSDYMNQFDDKSSVSVGPIDT